MSDATRFLTSLAQALAKMSLYSEGHPARGRAADASFEQLRLLQHVDARPIFSFLGREVIYAQRPLRDLTDWDWAERLSAAGVQRIEFQAAADREEYHAFLEDLLVRVALTVGATERTSRGVGGRRATPIRFGAIGVRGAGTDDGGVDAEDELGDVQAIDLSEEADVVDWMHGEVGDARTLPLVEAEAVVRSLALAMQSNRRALIPLLTLKEFDQYTTTHALNVAVLAMGLAGQLGLSSREVRAYGVAGLLHDLGKVKVPPEVLRKPGALTPDELELMRMHPGEGAKLILASDRTLDLCAVVAFEHHIMIDGTGYPARHCRRDCHHASKLVHVCDVFDALRTHRPYRVAWDTHSILEYIERRTGTEFEPEIANAFLAMMREGELHLASARGIDGEG